MVQHMKSQTMRYISHVFLHLFFVMCAVSICICTVILCLMITHLNVYIGIYKKLRDKVAKIELA